MVKIIRLPKILEITGLSKGSIYLKMKNGEFPKSVALGPNSTGWIESEVSDWLNNLMKNRDREAA